ncbi:MAG: phosphatidylserine decarboxylase [Gammaproteobacteria bacterium]|nr:phosphatidylserine decarboxylase [Gammaproteobacteria bacterium]
MHWLTRREISWLVQPAIRAFVSRFNVNLAEAAAPEPGAYASFNAFFTRALRGDARPLPAATNVLASPADGVLSNRGILDNDAMLQAKGRTYSVEALLGGADHAKGFHGGTSATIYLSPRDYHRLHMPWQGQLESMVYIPGDLFAVNPRTVRAVDGLFARNERVVAIFNSPAGRYALVLVGAIFVGSIETVWCGEVTPGSPRHLTVRAGSEFESPDFARGAEFARFNMGSTIVMVFEPGMVDLGIDAPAAVPSAIRMGEPMGRVLRV